MFSTMHNQKKAESLIAQARNAIDEADARFHEAKERLHKRIAEIDGVRSHFVRKSLAKFRELFGEMENEEPIELAPVSERPFSEQLQTLFEKSELEPVAIENVKRGKGGAFFTSLVATLVTVAVALVIGAVGAGLPLAPETFTQTPKLVRILEWLGGGFVAPHYANFLFGAGGLLLAALASWTIAWSIAMGKAARRNLAKAEAVFEKASAYAEKRGAYSDAIETLANDLQRLEKVFDTCDIFMQEFNASLRRILHVEGHDYRSFKPASQATVDRAAACAQSVVPILNLAIVTSEGTPSSQLEHAIAHGEKIVAALIEEKEIPL
ncbi:hypothetical protein, partial [Hydrogenimonas sp.]